MIEHASKGSPYCALCWQPAAKHRVRSQATPERREQKRRYNASELGQATQRTNRKHPRDYPMIGVDGEGLDACADCRGAIDPETNRCVLCESDNIGHYYTYLAAVDENGELQAEAYNPNGLTHEQCCDMLLSLPQHSLKFAYMFSYDITKIIEGLPDGVKARIMHPEYRRRKLCFNCKKSIKVSHRQCPKCKSRRLREYTRAVKYEGKAYDYFNGSFTIRDGLSLKDFRYEYKCHVWDCFRFFGGPFVDAIESWGVGTKEQVERIRDMKGKRGRFDKEDPEDVKKYCREECELLAKMMRKLVDAHFEEGWELRKFYGAGSTGAAMLHKYHVKDFSGPTLYEVNKLCDGFRTGVMSAFFGGRFEHSLVGTVEKTSWGYDISSAYPYAMSSLPCLACGQWRSVKRKALDKVKSARLALVRFTVKALPESERRAMAWAPLPYRDEKGSICYPLNFTGWAWSDEVLAAIEGWPGLIKVHEAFIFETDGCKGHFEGRNVPFSFLPEIYAKRILWGKEGPGLVLKLGANSGYGKCAQSVGGGGPFQNWIYAGLITSGCRAQILRSIAKAKDRWNIHAIATDGIYGSERLPIEIPRDTGTAWLPCPPLKEKDVAKLAKERQEHEALSEPYTPLYKRQGTQWLVNKPLGGWEEKLIPEGMFFVKPGLYYRLEAKLSDVRARGIGRREFYSAMQRLLDAFYAWDRTNPDYRVEIISRRFYGARNTIYLRSGCSFCKKAWPGPPEVAHCGHVGDRVGTTRQVNPEGKDVYGRWGARTIKIQFNPWPKREKTLKQGGKVARMHVRDVDGAVSNVYYPGSSTPEIDADHREYEEISSEQPDCVDILEE